MGERMQPITLILLTLTFLATRTAAAGATAVSQFANRVSRCSRRP